MLMTKNIMKRIIFAFILCSISCTPKANIKITDSNSVFLSVDVAPSSATKKLLKSLSSFGSDSAFLEQEEDVSNVETEDGIEIIKLKKTSSLDFSAKLKFSDSSKLLPSMFSFSKEKSNMKFSLDRKTLNSFFSNLANEDKEYLELLMAPSLQEVSMSDDEYIELIASAYGKKIASELKNSFLILSFETPSKIKNVSTSPKMEYEAKDAKVVLSLPLTYILVMNEAITIELDYSK